MYALVAYVLAKYRELTKKFTPCILQGVFFCYGTYNKNCISDLFIFIDRSGMQFFYVLDLSQNFSLYAFFVSKQNSCCKEVSLI